MKKLFMMLAIACALLMSVPVLAAPENSIACDNDVISASVGQSADVPSALAPGHAIASQAPACTSEAAPASDRGASLSYLSLDNGTAGTPQRLEVAAATRAVVG